MSAEKLAFEPIPDDPKFRDLTGTRFERLLVLGWAGLVERARGNRLRRESSWWCRCDCGKILNVRGYKLASGHTKSCGCYGQDARVASTRTHGCTSGRRGESRPTPEYRIWCGILTRCYNPAVREYPCYGGRGVAVCDRWRHDFSAFLADVGPRPSPQHSIDRIDVNGPYSPENCRWASVDEQARNRRGVKTVLFCGKEYSASQFAREIGVSHTTVYWGLDRGLTPEEMAAKATRRRQKGPRQLRGPSDEPTYAIWRAMIHRCHNPRNRQYAYYGGRGIAVCASWRESFASFVQDVGERPSPRYTLERERNDEGYEPGNVSWQTHTHQNRNRRSNRHLEFQGQTKTVAEWAEITSIPAGRIAARIDNLGWSVERALTEPIHPQTH